MSFNTLLIVSSSSLIIFSVAWLSGLIIRKQLISSSHGKRTSNKSPVVKKCGDYPTKNRPPSVVKNACDLAPEKVSIERLKLLVPIRHISDEILTLVHKETEPWGKGSVLFKAGDCDEYVLYLLEGIVLVETEEGRKYEIKAGKPKSRFPLSTNKNRATGYAKTDVQILRIPNKVMKQGDISIPREFSTVDLNSKNLSSEMQHSGLLHSFCRHISKNELELPSLPDIALRVRRAIKKDLSVSDVVKIIQTDPSMVAKLIQVANSPLYLTDCPAINCHDAILRLGLHATRDLVTSVSLHQVFNSKHTTFNAYLKKLWMNSVSMSCLCFALASKTRSVDPDKALLAGLVCDIGIVPFLHFAQDYPEELTNKKELEEIISVIRGTIGAMVLKKWGFPEELQVIPIQADNWFYDENEQLSLTDIVLLARLHSYVGTKKMAELPNINTIPAYSKFENIGLTPELSLDILQETKDQIKSAYQLIS